MKLFSVVFKNKAQNHFCLFDCSISIIALCDIIFFWLMPTPSYNAQGLKGWGDVVLDLVLEAHMVTNTPREKAMINVMEKVIPTAVETSMEGTWLAAKWHHTQNVTQECYF